MSKKLRFNTVRDNRVFIVDSNKINQFLYRKNTTSQDAINRLEKRKKDNTDKA